MPTPAPTLTPAPTPRYQIVTRDQEYGYTIDLPDGWVVEEEHLSSPQGGSLYVRSVNLVAGTTLDEYAESVKDNLRGDWWPTASVFEITHFDKKTAGDQELYSLVYRVQKSPDLCMLEVVEVVGIGASLPGQSSGFRTRHQVCSGQLNEGLARDRKQALDSFRIITRPATYYKQFIRTEEGITIKATGKVNPAALQAAADIVGVMLDGREDIPSCLTRAGASVAIIPKDELVITLPEFVGMKGKIAWEGTEFETKLEDSRGVSAGTAQPVAAVAEERLLIFPEGGGISPNPATMRPRTTIHEFAHSIDILCFTREDREEWDALYREALHANALPGAYALVSAREFFADLTTIYFASAHGGYGTPAKARLRLETDLSEVWKFLERIYGGLMLEMDPGGQYARLVTVEGATVPTVTIYPGGTYQDTKLGYSIDIVPDWKVEPLDSYRTLISLISEGGSKVRIDYTRMASGADTETELRRLAESRPQGWERLTRGWDKTEVKYFERESAEGQDSYWIHYYGHESPDHCEFVVIERVLIAASEEDNFGVVLRGSTCRANSVARQDIETMIRSFTP